jgi:hypothetical protein
MKISPPKLTRDRTTAVVYGSIQEGEKYASHSGRNNWENTKSATFKQLIFI